ncbi:bifunctional diaminohydroxyphosphoribosylaminopyrimidine deaminase/5-amino-6-(5-phosphoribosylamino)uracil reductase RibD [Xanthomonadaceae bacterium XH05]|nr:bifunctional diaminohydroxyphosphoribosylaminopyrimidine deaminase/5-amino-6-(5-phosphoribosylamino)uracil reductase RibD [Xanthomonadaceae bacterium XH05]
MSASGFSATDHAMMVRALRLAERGAFTTRPNPMVGCVVACGDEIVGEGWHQRAGGPHAEVFALRAAGERARGATAYVTLEPCAHHGRTPPCVDALVESGVARVVAAMRDPFPQVAGHGFERLRAAGVVVDTGLLDVQARELNRGFLSRIERGRPRVRVKLAMSLDGRTALANGDSKWITGEAARTDVQRWRARAGAILTGSGTVLADNPRLTARVPNADIAPVLRVVMDRALRTPAGMHVLAGDAPTLVFHAPDAMPDARYTQVECESLALAGDRLSLPLALERLAARGINDVHVEAGPVLSGALFEQGLVDELLLYVAPVLLGSSARPLLQLPALADMAERWHLQVVDHGKVGEDWRLVLRPSCQTPGQDGRTPAVPARQRVMMAPNPVFSERTR